MKETADAKGTLARLAGGLVVSCQPVPGSPFDTTEAIVAYARAAEARGAAGLRIEGVRNVEHVTRAVALPVIGIVKRDLSDSAVRITPFLHDLEALARAGATIVAFDGTDRPRPVGVARLIEEARRYGVLAMADIATEAEARTAVALGVDIVGTTLSGYTGPGPTPQVPDIELVCRCLPMGVPVLAEGRYNAPELAAAAIAAGAHAVVVGSAITRPEHVVDWFREAIAAAARPAEPVLAFDVGGTKTLAALVSGDRILERRQVRTRRDVGAPGWVEDLAGLAADWRGRYRRAAAAVTGLVADGLWSSLNPDTLAIPEGFPLARRLADALGAPVEVVNDAQAAAWGEYRFGAGQGCDMAFLTISSGVGGGLVVAGRLLRGARGLAGSLGQAPVRRTAGIRPLEAVASGFALAAGARAGGRAVDARAVCDAAIAGEAWAESLLAGMAEELAMAIAGLQAVVDPERIVVGGGLGLSNGLLARLERALAGCQPALIPHLVPAALGFDAGIIGAANLALLPEDAAAKAGRTTLNDRA